MTGDWQRQTLPSTGVRNRQAQRVQRALKRIDPGDVLAIIDSRIAQ